MRPHLDAGVPVVDVFTPDAPGYTSCGLLALLINIRDQLAESLTERG